MGRKSLRKNTKKNYKKLASGVEGDLDDSYDGDPKTCVSDDENGAHGGDQCKQSPNPNKKTDIDSNKQKKASWDKNFQEFTAIHGSKRNMKQLKVSFFFLLM